MWGYSAYVWKTIAMSRSRGAQFVTSRPSMLTRPAVTSSRPAIIRSSVDLPQPDGPVTERRRADDLDLRTTRELVELMNREEATVPTVVGAAAQQIAAVVDEVVARLARGGRLVYAGAGTSGRLAAGDAAECEAT